MNKDRAKDIQIGGEHYAHMDMQPIDFIQANKLPFCEGNIIKYICRHARKGGKEDLLKAKHYIDLIISHNYSG